MLALAGIVSPVIAQQLSATPPILPDPKLTPGDTFPVELADIQVKGYSATVRDVPTKEKRAVYASTASRTGTKESTRWTT